MEENDYKYSVEVTKLVRILSSADESFKRNREELRDLGIERLTINEIKDRVASDLPFTIKKQPDEKIIFIQSAKFTGRKLLLNRLDESTLGSIIFHQCSLPYTEIRDCTFRYNENEKYKTSFFCLIESQIENLKIRDSTVGHVLILDKSTTGQIRVLNSILGDQLVRNKSQIGNFSIQNDSKTGDFTLNENSISGTLSISKSKTSSFNIVDSKTGWVTIREKAITEVFKIKNSILDNISVDDSTIGGLNLQENSDINYIQFENNSVCTGNYFFKKTTVNNLVIQKSVVQDILILENSTVNFLRIKHNSTTGKISIRDSTTNYIYIDSSQTEDIVLSRTSIKLFSTDNESNTGKISLFRSDVENLKINESTIGSILNIESSTIEWVNLKNVVCNILIWSSTIPKLYITRSYLIELMIARGSEIALIVDNGSINFLNLSDSTVEQSSAISFNNLNIYTCIIEGFNNLGKIYFRKIRPMTKSPLLPDFIGTQERELISTSLSSLSENHKLRSKFRISSSSLGTTEFIDCEFANFESFEFNNSRITDIFISGGTLPEEDRIIIYGEEKGSNIWHDQMISLYSQLSNVYQSQGRSFQSIDYKSRTAFYKHELLKQSIQIEDNPSLNTRWANLLERFPFFWNKLSNEYGANWWQAVKFIFGFSLILYLLALLTTGNLFGPITNFDVKFVGFYFDFINPLRPFDFYDRIGVEANFGTRIIDFLSRVIIGYGVYQLITAFRRYGRK